MVVPFESQFARVTLCNASVCSDSTRSISAFRKLIWPRWHSRPSAYLVPIYIKERRHAYYRDQGR